jgi:NAD(P)-dependent dehydrogenase (short-subunit alcohol dehydrogenase family)
MGSLARTGQGTLRSRVAVITGGGSGLGRATAAAFTREGARVVIAARNRDRLEAVAREICAESAAQVLAVPTDVADEAQVIALFDRTMETFGRLDVLVNSAGIWEEAPIDQMTLACWQKTLDICLTGPFLCTREAFKIMKQQGGGRIINIGSIAALSPRPTSAHYSSAKLGLVALTRATALAGRDCGVVASCLHPGNMATAMMDGLEHEPMIAVDEVARILTTMASLPLDTNMLETIVFPTVQPFLGRG